MNKFLQTYFKKNQMKMSNTGHQSRIKPTIKDLKFAVFLVLAQKDFMLLRVMGQPKRGQYIRSPMGVEHSGEGIFVCRSHNAKLFE